MFVAKGLLAEFLSNDAIAGCKAMGWKTGQKKLDGTTGAPNCSYFLFIFFFIVQQFFVHIDS